MKNFFRIVGICTLFVFGFFYTEKTTTVMENMDGLMVQIKEVSAHYKENPIEAVIHKNEMIPGVSGREVDENKSYRSMKRVGTFNPGLLEYQSLLPEKSIKKNFSYYIVGGNPKKNMVSLLFLVDKNTDTNKLKKLVEILKIKKSKGTFFIDGYWFEENNDFINYLAEENQDLGNLSYNRDYTDSSFIWMDTIMKRVLKRKFGFCYNEKENKVALDICKMYHNYTVRPTLTIENNPLATIKKEVQAGDIVSMRVSDETLKELPSIITYIESKGYKIETLSDHLKE